MEKLYLTDFFEKYGVQYDESMINLISIPCGSGKSHYCMDFIYKHKTNNFNLAWENASNEISKKYKKIMYVTDTTNLRESVHISYIKKLQKEGHTNIYDSAFTHVKFITYKSLGIMLETVEGFNEVVTEYEYIFLDEIHQLFRYHEKFDSLNKTSMSEKGHYQQVIDNLHLLLDHINIIALTATPESMLQGFRKHKNLINDVISNINEKYNINAVDLLVQHETKYHCIFDDVKTVIKEVAMRVKDNDDKVLIYTQKIEDMKNLRSYVRKLGYSCEGIWSVNNKKHIMTEKQHMLLDSVKETGEYEYKFLIINDSCESGINIENDNNSSQNTKYIIVNHSDETTIEQIRGRIRHDIDTLYTGGSTIDFNSAKDCTNESVRIYNWYLQERSKDKTFFVRQHIVGEDTEYIAYKLDLRDRNGLKKTPKAINDYLDKISLNDELDMSLFRIEKRRIMKSGERMYVWVFVDII